MDASGAEINPVDFVARARVIGPILSEEAVEIERRGELPQPVVSALIGQGLFRMLQPRSIGGAEIDPVTFVRVMEEIGKADASTGWCLGQGSGCAMAAAYLAPDVANEIFGPPDGVLAWGPPAPSEARAVPGGYRVTGRWSYASGSHHATWLGAHVLVTEADGSPRKGPGGAPIRRTMLFPKSDARMHDIWNVMGLKGTGSDSYSVEDLFVPERHTLSRDDPAERREAGRLYKLTSSNMYAVGYGGLALGIARAALDAFVVLARDKVPRGAKRTMRDNNVIQSQVAQAEAKLRAARAFLLGSLGEMWEALDSAPRLDAAQSTRLRLCSTFAIHQARDVVGTVYHAAGATAIFNGNPFERRFRDINTLTQQNQGRQIHFETVGQMLLGLDPENAMYAV